MEKKFFTDKETTKEQYLKFKEYIKSEAEKDPSQIIYSMDESQKLSLEKDINNSLVQLEKYFKKTKSLNFYIKTYSKVKLIFQKKSNPKKKK